MIDIILISPRYTFLSLIIKNSGVKRIWLEIILGLVTDQEVFSGAHK
jgi:hypothetical protein